MLNYIIAIQKYVFYSIIQFDIYPNHIQILLKLKRNEMERKREQTIGKFIKIEEKITWIAVKWIICFLAVF